MLKNIKLIISLFIIILLFLVLKNKWISSDGLSVIYQTLNLFNGDGLTWNIGEKTYVSTSPLLSILTILFSSVLIPLFKLAGISYVKYMGIANNLIVSGVFIYLLHQYLYRLSPKINTSIKKMTLVIIFLLVLLSNYFIDFFTSGLENSISYLFVFLYVSILLGNGNKMKFLPIILSLLFLVRYDFAILFYPVLISLLLKNKFSKYNISMAAIVLTWFAFSFLYFGSIFPNSFYLKTDHFSIYQSFYYLWSNMMHSPAMFILIILGLYCSFFNNKLLFVGLFSYFIYVFIVKDYMLGRLFTVLIPACLASIVFYIANNPVLFRYNKFVFAGFIIIIFVNIMLIKDVEKHGKYNLADERKYYTKIIPLLKIDLIYTPQEKPYITINKDLTMLHSPFLPIHSKQTYYLDPVGLSHPFITYYIKNYGSKGDRPGHYQADLQYLKSIGLDESILKNKNIIKDENIRQLYNDVNMVMKGDCFDYNRLKTIIKLHTHNYNIKGEKLY